MTFAEFCALSNPEKAGLVENRIAREVEMATWAASGGGSYYTSFTDGEVVAVQEDGSDYAEKFTVADCDATASSFFFDQDNRRLYVHTSGGDSPDTQTVPGTYDYLIVAFFWLLIDNVGGVYTKEIERLTDGGLELWDDATTLTHWTFGKAGGTSSANKESTTVYEGAYSCRFDVDAGDNDAWIYQDIIMRPSRTHRLSFYYMMSNIGITGQVQIRDSGSNVYLQDDYTWGAGANWIQLPNATVWTLGEIEFAAHASYSAYRLTISTESGASLSMYVDKAALAGALLPAFALPDLGESAIPGITQSVGEYYTGNVEMNFGSIELNNDGWWYTALSSYIFHNKDLRVLIGAVDSDYQDLEPVFVGKSRTPTVSDSGASIETADNRVGEFRSIPINKYWISNYPNLESGKEGQPIPLLFGEVENISPVCIDTTIYKYKIADHQLQAISDVYKDGVTLTNVTDYTKDLANGEFTLAADPGDAPITCDAQGLLCDYDDGTYSTNIADFLHYTLVTLNGIPRSLIDYASFNDLKAARTQVMAWYLDCNMDNSWDFVRLLQASGIFHLVPMPSGKYGAFRYVSGTTSSTPIVRQEDYIGDVEIAYETSAAFKKVVIKYDYDPTTQVWAQAEVSDDKISRRYDIEETLTIETALTSSAEAAALAVVYQNFTRAPVKQLRTTVPAFALNLKPTDKLICSKEITDGNGDEVTIFDREVYRILGLGKNISRGNAQIFGILDAQAVGGTHADTAHSDSHTDTHGDVAHVDLAHSDGTYEDHDDILHTDEHGDTEHADTEHADSHADSHADVHFDYHDDQVDPHYDSHSDEYTDEHADEHTDEHTDTEHADSYNDVEHEDAFHSDHGDTAHSDTAHTDAHDDSYSDVPHVDSEY